MTEVPCGEQGFRTFVLSALQKTWLKREVNLNPYSLALVKSSSILLTLIDLCEVMR